MAESKKKAATQRVYTIPLREAWKGAYKRRAKKAIIFIKAFITRHMKAENVKIGTELNHAVWERGIKNPPRKVKVQAVEHEGSVWVELQGVELKFKTTEEPKTKADSKKEKKSDDKKEVKEKAEKQKAKPVAKPKTKKPADEKKATPKKSEAKPAKPKDTKEPSKEPKE